MTVHDDGGLGQFIRVNWPEKVSAEILYHYTSHKVLTQFLKGDAILYCTRIDELNDKNENRWGFAYLCTYLRRRYGWERPEIVLLHKYCLNLMRECKGFLPGSMSFSYKGNNGGLWNLQKGYIPKEGGYSIGFHKSDLLKNIYEVNKTYSSHEILLIPIFYLGVDKEAINRIIEFYLACTFSRLRKYIHAPNAWIQHTNVIGRLLLFPLFIKGRVWSEVKELRLVFINRSLKMSCKTVVVGGKNRYPSISCLQRHCGVNMMIRKIYASPFPTSNRECRMDSIRHELRKVKLDRRIAVDYGYVDNG